MEEPSLAVFHPVLRVRGVPLGLALALLRWKRNNRECLTATHFRHSGLRRFKAVN